MPLYELEEGTSRKFYRIELHDTRVHLNWGRIGSDGQHQVLAHENAAAARAEYQRQIDRRLERGYRLVVDEGVPHAPEALEKARLARTGALSESPRFLFVHRAKKRFAWVEARGNTVLYASGGAAHEESKQPTRKPFDSPAAALRERDKLVAQLIARGYELETFGAKEAKPKRGTTELVFDEDLERAVAEDPYDDAAWTVLEDWILQQADPRADLVRFAKEQLHSDAAMAHGRAAPWLFGPKHQALANATHLSTWRAGYLEDCFYAEPGRGGVGLAEQFYRAPAARLIRELRLELPKAPRFAAHVAAISKARCRHSLRKLELLGTGKPMPYPIDAHLFDAIPHLRWLGVELGGCKLIGTAPIAVEHLAVELDSFAVLESWLARSYPALQTLRIDLLPLDGYALARRFAALLARCTAPMLHTFHARCATEESADAVFTALAKSHLRAQLRSVIVLRGLHVHRQVDDAASWPSS